MTRSALLCAGLLAALPACEAWEPPPRAPETVIYQVTTNIYVEMAPATAPSVAPSAPAEVALLPAPVPAMTGEPLGPIEVDVCDALLSTSARCVSALTAEAGARARANDALARARRAMERAASGGGEQRRALAEACRSALDAYRVAPCTNLDAPSPTTGRSTDVAEPARGNR